MEEGAAPEALSAKAATQAEIVQAIESLTDEDSERLEQLAINRVIRIGRKAANGRTSEDLLQEAMRRTLEGQRHWYPKNVDFVSYLLGAVRSIASAWAGHRERNPDSPEYAALESELTRDDEEGNPISRLDGTGSRVPNSEERMIEVEAEAEQEALVSAIEQHFADDENASYVLMGWQDGMEGPAIREACGFNETTYRAIVRRIKRNSQRIMDERHGE